MTVQEQQVEQSFPVGNLPKLYFNNFAVGYSPVDVLVQLAQNGTPLVEVNMTFAIAKPLAESLAATVGTVEKLLGGQIIRAEEKEKEKTE